MTSLAIVYILLSCSSLVYLFSCTPSSSGPRTQPSLSFHSGMGSRETISCGEELGCKEIAVVVAVVVIRSDNCK